MEPWMVPQDFYDMVMERADGADITDLFDIDDPEWKVMKVTLFKTEDGQALLSCNSILAMEPEPAEEQN